MTHSGLEQLLASWLPAQRWFAGSGATVGDLQISSDVELSAGDPELRHLMVDVWLGENKVTYQVLVAFRAELPAQCAAAVIGMMADGRTAYDGTADPELTALLLQGIAAQRVAGPLRFGTEPGCTIDPALPGRTLAAATSNTSVIFGQTGILKLLRRPFEGHHPDLEIPAALAKGGSKLVAAPLGWIEFAAAGHQGQPVVLAILSEFLPNAADGWDLALADLDSALPDFPAAARQLGEATARLHAELAAAFGAAVLSPAEVAQLAAAMTAELERAVSAVPQLRDYEAGIRACYAEMAAPGTRVAVQRIHGDYHLAQVLRTDAGWVVLDFEGEPSVPLARRRAFAPAMRDVAGMLRSFDYAARHQALLRPADQRLAAVAPQWARSCQEAFCAGYARAGDGDQLTDGTLLRALTFSKAVYEAEYEVKHRPDWLPIPLAALAEART
jgi:maltokinase